jgi:hypothetical protein
VPPPGRVADLDVIPSPRVCADDNSHGEFDEL